MLSTKITSNLMRKGFYQDMIMKIRLIFLDFSYKSLFKWKINCMRLAAKTKVDAAVLRSERDDADECAINNFDVWCWFG